MDHEAIEALFARCPDAVAAWVDADGWIEPAIGTARLAGGRVEFHATGRVSSRHAPVGAPACCVAEESPSHDDIRSAIARGRVDPDGDGAVIGITIDGMTSFDFSKAG
jgi:hypothetical protein